MTSGEAASMFIGSAGRGGIVFVLAALAAVALWRTAASTRHAIWAVAVTAALLTPAAALLPVWHILPTWPMLPARPVSAITSLEAAPRGLALSAGENKSHSIYPSHVGPSIDWAAVAVAVWSFGGAIGLLPWVVGSVYLQWLKRACRTVDDPALLRQLDAARAALGVRRSVALLTRDDPTTPMTWGVLRPTVLLPSDAADWPAERQRAVLLHEGRARGAVGLPDPRHRPTRSGGALVQPAGVGGRMAARRGAGAGLRRRCDRRRRATVGVRGGAAGAGERRSPARWFGGRSVVYGRAAGSRRS